MQADEVKRLMRRVETTRGTGEAAWRGEVLAGIGYEISRFQAMTTGGLPIPGLHRIEGSLDLSALDAPRLKAGENLELRLEDGRTIALTLTSDEGHVLAEGHGPSRCSCC